LGVTSVASGNIRSRIAAVAAGFAVVLLSIGVLSFVVGYGFVKKVPHVRRLAKAMAVVDVVFGVFLAVTGGGLAGLAYALLGVATGYASFRSAFAPFME
jgi:hypothetical protein